MTLDLEKVGILAIALKNRPMNKSRLVILTSDFLEWPQGADGPIRKAIDDLVVTGNLRRVGSGYEITIRGYETLRSTRQTTLIVADKIRGLVV